MLITCHKKALIGRCLERGYKLHDVMPCVVAQDGDTWTIDTDHAKYPKKRSINEEMRAIAIQRQRELLKRQEQAQAVNVPPPPPTEGAGAELKKLLSKIGIKASPTCSCNARARIMDDKGIQWCKDNVDMIVGWLREEATKRNLPFVDMAGRLLVKRAISLAEKAEKKKEKAKTANG
ncbi:hypothetical protein EBZ39_04575 [bacterium]|nr:hypothetical protein [bacterium]